MQTSTNNFSYKPITIKDLEELADKLIPKKLIITSDEELYKLVLEIPNINKEAIKFTKMVEGTFVVDNPTIKGMVSKLTI